MRLVLGFTGLALLLTACGDEAPPDDRSAADDRDVAMVEAANKAAPPVQLVTPEPQAPDGPDSEPPRPPGGPRPALKRVK